MSSQLTLTIIKIVSILFIFLTALAAGIYPFFKKWRSGTSQFSTGQALASGVFLGAGLIHMLGDANTDFVALKIDYPLAFLIAGGTFLIFLAFEQLGQELYRSRNANENSFVTIAFLMLSIHSLFAGAALGLSTHLTVVIVLLLAIIAHKWAASFALATQIIRSHLSKKTSYLLFTIFCMMTPIGIFFGNLVSTTLSQYQYIEPTFNALAAGTFLYLGTLHGLSHAFMVDKCCSLKNLTFVMVGFGLMAIVAIWT